MLDNVSGSTISSKSDALYQLYNSIQYAGYTCDYYIRSLFTKLYPDIFQEQVFNFFVNAPKHICSLWEELSSYHKKFFYLSMMVQAKKLLPSMQFLLTSIDLGHCLMLEDLQLACKTKLIQGYKYDANISIFKNYLIDTLGMRTSFTQSDFVSGVMRELVHNKLEAHKEVMYDALHQFVQYIQKNSISTDFSKKYVDLYETFTQLRTNYRYDIFLDSLYNKHFSTILQECIEKICLDNIHTHDRRKIFSDQEKKGILQQITHKLDTLHLNKHTLYDIFAFRVIKDFLSSGQDSAQFKRFVDSKLGLIVSASSKELGIISYRKEELQQLLNQNTFFLFNDLPLFTQKQQHTDSHEHSNIEKQESAIPYESGSFTTSFQENKLHTDKRMSFTKDVIVSKPTYHKEHSNLTEGNATKDVYATFANVTGLSTERLNKKILGELGEEYKNSAPYSLRRAKFFFFRSAYISKKIRSYLKDTFGTIITDTEISSAVNRWNLQKAFGLIDMENVSENKDIFADANFCSTLDELVNAYIDDKSGVSADLFREKILKLFDTYQPLKKYMQEKDIAHVATNFFHIVEIEKKEKALYDALLGYIDGLGTKYTLSDFDQQVRKLLEDFTRENKNLPNFIRELGLDLDSVNFCTTLAKHRETVQRMKLRTIRMKLQLLFPSNQDKNPLQPAHSVQVEKFGKIPGMYKWMEKHPWWTILGTSIGLVGSAAIGLTTIPFIGASLGASVLFVLNYIKKYGRYTYEHAKFEQFLLSLSEEQREAYLSNLQKKAEKRPKWIKKFFPSMYHKFASCIDYVDAMPSVQYYIQTIQSYVSAPRVLSLEEKIRLQYVLIEAIALLCLKQLEGRNFMYSERGQDTLEQEYDILFRTIQAGLTRYDPTRDSQEILKHFFTLIQEGNYIETIKKDAKFEENMNRMRSIRSKIALLAGSKSVALYLLSARIFGQISTTWDAIFNSSDSIQQNNAITEPLSLSTVPIHQIDVSTITIDDRILSLVQSEPAFSTVNFGNLDTNTLHDMIKRLFDKGYTFSISTDGTEINVMGSISATDPSTYRRDPAFGPGGKNLLTHIFEGDTEKFEKFKHIVLGLSENDTHTTLRGIFKDIYGGSYDLANQKTHQFFEYFGDKIMEGRNFEILTLTQKDPLTWQGAQRIATKMTEWYAHAGVLSPEELQTVTDPVAIKNLFDGFANGKYDLRNLPSGWNMRTVHAALHCKYAGFGSGLKSYIFDVAQEKITYSVGRIHIGTSDTTRTSTSLVSNILQALSKHEASRFNAFGVPSFWDECNYFTTKK